MPQFRSLSLRLIVILLLISTSVLSIFGYYSYRQNTKALYDQYDKAIELTTERLLLSLPNPVWNFEMKSIRKILESEIKSEYFLTIVLLDDQGALLSGATKKQGNIHFLKEQPKIDESFQSYTITMNGEDLQTDVGQLLIQTSDKPIKKFLANEIKTEFIKIIVLNLIIIVLLSISINAVVKPLRMLAKIAEKIAAGDLETEVKTGRHDEVGDLAKNFDLMRIKVRRKLKDLTELNRTGEDISGATSQYEAIQKSVETIMSKMHFESTAVYLGVEGNEFELKFDKSVHETNLSAHDLNEIGAISKTTEKGKNILFIDDIEKHPTITKDEQANIAKSALIVTLLDQNELIGIIIFTGEIEQVAFQEGDEEFIETITRSLVITLKNIRMREVIEEHARTLERKVQERTASLQEKTNDIMSMMRNMKQGLFTILENAHIHSEYASFLENIFETNRIAGTDAINLLFANSTVSADIISQMRASIDTIIDGEELMWDFNSHLFIGEYEADINGNRKILSLDWNPIVHDGQIEKIMVTVRDVTELKSLEKEALEKKRELQIISQLIRLDDAKFRDFLNSSDELLSNSLAVLQGREPAQDMLTKLFRNMHTVKGNARTHNFTLISDAAHEIESVYDSLRKDTSKAWDKNELKKDINNLQSVISEHSRIFEQVLGKHLKIDSINSFDALNDKAYSQLTNLLAKILQQNKLDSNLKKEITEAYEGFKKSNTIPLGEVLTDICQSISSIAEMLGKNSPTIKIEGRDIPIERSDSSLLKNIFSHLLRNSIDHGIETAEERKMKGKPSAGNITIKAKEDPEGGLHFFITDDGRGIHLENLREKAKDLNLISSHEDPDEKTIAQFIFAPGFSTKKEVTDISGRGVGMDAVKRFIEERHGKVEIITNFSLTAEDYTPIEIQIHLPKIE